MGRTAGGAGKTPTVICLAAWNKEVAQEHSIYSNITVSTMSPAAVERIGEIKESGRWVPEFLSLSTATSRGQLRLKAAT